MFENLSMLRFSLCQSCQFEKSGPRCFPGDQLSRTRSLSKNQAANFAQPLARWFPGGQLSRTRSLSKCLTCSCSEGRRRHWAFLDNNIGIAPSGGMRLISQCSWKIWGGLKIPQVLKSIFWKAILQACFWLCSLKTRVYCFATGHKSYLLLKGVCLGPRRLVPLVLLKKGHCQ